jgi:integrase
MVPVGEYIAQWIEERPGLAIRTVELYEGLLRNHIGPHIGHVMVGDMSTAKVRTWRKGLLDAGVGAVTVAKAYRLLKAAMNTAHLEDGLIKSNPCVIKGASVEKSPERPIATIEEAFKAADAIQPRYRLMVLLATFASLRFAEMVGLQRQGLDLVNGVVHVRRQAIQTNKQEIIATDPKSAAGKRRVIVPPFMIAEMAAHLDRFVKPAKSAWVFLGPKGGRPTRNNFHTVWAKAREAAGIPELHLHDLRHTGNTLAAETGATLRELMDRMGHGSTRAALVYLHAREERGKDIARGMDDMVKKARKKAKKKSGKKRKKAEAGKAREQGETGQVVADQAAADQTGVRKEEAGQEGEAPAGTKGHARGTTGEKTGTKDGQTPVKPALTCEKKMERVTGIEPA